MVQPVGLRHHRPNITWSVYCVRLQVFDPNFGRLNCFRSLCIFFATNFKIYFDNCLFLNRSVVWFVVSFNKSQFKFEALHSEIRYSFIIQDVVSIKLCIRLSHVTKQSVQKFTKRQNINAGSYDNIILLQVTFIGLF